MKKRTVAATSPTTYNTEEKYFDRFLSKVVVNPQTQCWEYQGGLASNGYGIFWDGKRSVLSHRYAFETMVDALPADGVLHHICNVKNCVSPEHIRPATHKENSAEAIPDGLLTSARRPYVKASTDEIADIRNRSGKGQSNYSIAKRYGRAETYIASVLSGKIHSPELKTARAQRVAQREAEKAARVPGKRGPKPKSPASSLALQEAA